MAISRLYKDHMILSFAVFNRDKNSWEPRVEILLPRKEGLGFTYKQDAEDAGIESGIKIIDYGMRSDLAAEHSTSGRITLENSASNSKTDP